MLITQEAQGKAPRPQGCVRTSLAELRSQLADPASLSDGNRQRLLDLVRRLARVQALGDEYVRVDLSDGALRAASQGHAGADRPGPVVMA
jgi:hypothetical protein